MKFHKFFSLKRFGRLLAADLRLNSKRYLYTIAGAAVGIYLLLLFGMLFNQYETIYVVHYLVMFIFSLLAFGAYIGSAFPSFSEKTTTVNFLLFPASSFEKLLSQFLLYYVAGTIVFVFLFWVDAHLARLSLSNLEAVRTGKWIIQPFSYGGFFEAHRTQDITHVSLLTMTVFSIAGFLFTTRLFFSRFALAKSIISGIVLFISFILVLILSSHLFFPEKTQGFNIAAPVYSSLWGVTNFEAQKLR
jgi:hypothetical protein